MRKARRRRKGLSLARRPYLKFLDEHANAWDSPVHLAG